MSDFLVYQRSTSSTAPPSLDVVHQSRVFDEVDKVVVVGDGRGDRGQLSALSHGGWVGEVFEASRGIVTVDLQFNVHGGAVEAADRFRASQLVHFPTRSWS